MATDIIDSGVYKRATNYIGKGTIDANSVTAAGVVNMTTGDFTSAGNDVQINLGFAPRQIKVINSTDTIVWEKNVGMAAANAVKTTSSATAIDTGSAITFTTDLAGNAIVTLAAATVGTSKAISYVIFG